MERVPETAGRLMHDGRKKRGNCLTNAGEYVGSLNRTRLVVRCFGNFGKSHNRNESRPFAHQLAPKLMKWVSTTFDTPFSVQSHAGWVGLLAHSLTHSTALTQVVQEAYDSCTWISSGPYPYWTGPEMIAVVVVVVVPMLIRRLIRAKHWNPKATAYNREEEGQRRENK